jgi:hypothetical protein
MCFVGFLSQSVNKNFCLTRSAVDDLEYILDNRGLNNRGRSSIIKEEGATISMLYCSEHYPGRKK